MDSRSLRRGITGLVVTTALAAAACAPPAAPSPPAQATAGGTSQASLKHVVVTQSVSDSVSFVPIDIARHFDYFGQEGLSVDFIVTNGGGPDVAALVANQAQFTVAGPINQLALYQEGQKTLSVASFLDHLVDNIVVSKDVYQSKGISTSTSLDDRAKALKGLKISVTKKGALTDMVARAYVRRAGLDPDKDVQIIATASGQPQIAAMQQKEVDAASVTSPAAETIVAQGAGVMLVNNTQGEDPFFAPFTQQSVLVRADYAQQNPEIVKAFVRAIVKADKWAHDHTAEEGAAIFHEYAPTMDQAEINKQYGYIKDGIPVDGCMTQKGIEGNIKLFEAAGLLKQDIKWTDLATNDYLPTKCAG